MTKAIIVERPGGPEALTLTDITLPEPGPQELLVQVVAAGVNYIDVYHRTGRYPLPLPFGIGKEGAGIVTAVGSEVSDFRIGDHVAWWNATGSYAEHVLLPAHEVVLVPENIDLATAAAVLLQGLTAHYLATSTYPIRQGDTVLIHAAAGGVGLLLTQFAKLAGARVIGTVSSDSKAQLAREAGVDEIIRYDQTDFASVVHELTGGKGVAAVYDGVGKTTFDKSLASLQTRGYFILYGGSSGAVSPIDPQQLGSAGSVYLTRPILAAYVADPAERQWRVSELFSALDTGQLHVRIGHQYPLDQARRAHEDIESRKTTGKLLLVP